MTETYTPEQSMKSGRYLDYGGQYLPEILLPEIKRV
jgi:tryptophan synthase beta chain